MTDNRTLKKHRKTLAAIAWNWRKRRLPGADFATLAVVEEAFIAGARWAQRKAKQ